MSRLSRTLRRAALAIGLMSVCAPGFASETKSDFSMADIENVDPLREAFNRDQGSPRLILLLSPT